MHKFFNQETNEWENVLPEAYRWEVHYQNGEVLKQFDDAQLLFHRFSEIDQTRPFVFKMVGAQTFTLLFEPSMKLIHFYRTAILNNGTQRVRLYCFGYQRGGEKIIMVITPSGELVVTDDIAKVKVV